MKPMKSVNVKKSPFLPATESYCELLGYQKVRNHVKLMRVINSRRGFSKGTVLCGGY